MEISDLARSILDSFDNSNEGLAIWNKEDKLVGFNKKYSKIFKRNMAIEAKVGLDFSSSYEEASKKPGSSKMHPTPSCTIWADFSNSLDLKNHPKTTTTTTSSLRF